MERLQAGDSGEESGPEEDEEGAPLDEDEDFYDDVKYEGYARL